MTQWRLFWNVGQKPKNSTQRKSLLSILLRRTSPSYCKDNKEPHQTFFDLQLWSWGFCTVVQLYEKCLSKIPNVKQRWIGHDQCYWRWYQDTNDTLVIGSSNICTHLTHTSKLSEFNALSWKKIWTNNVRTTFFTLLLFLEGAIFVLIWSSVLLPQLFRTKMCVLCLNWYQLSSISNQIEIY